MSLQSKNFLFKRTEKDDSVLHHKDSDYWGEGNVDYMWNEVSEPLPASGYYGSTNGLHTIAFILRSFIGRVYLQGTLSSQPEEDDWFTIELDGNEYIEMNDSVMDHPDRENVLMRHGFTGTKSFSVKGNFTYLRVGISRNYISTEPSLLQKQVSGKVEEVLINY